MYLAGGRAQFGSTDSQYPGTPGKIAITAVEPAEGVLMAVVRRAG